MLEALLHGIVDFMAQHHLLALVIIFLIATGEALFIIGLFVPSTVVLVGAGALVGAGKLPFLPVFLCTAIGAMVGDALSYWIGQRYHQDIRRLWPFNRYPAIITHGEKFFARFGGSSVFLGRFVPGVKAVIPGIAGMMGMNAAYFTFINVTSAIVWAAAHILPGMGIGLGLKALSASSLRLVAVILVLLFLLWLIYRLLAFILRRGVPLAVARLRQAADHALDNERPGAHFFHALAYDKRGVMTPLGWLTLGASAAFGFLFFLDFTSQQKIASDQALLNLIQSFRTPEADFFFTAVTMAGDRIVLLITALALVATLLILRAWRTALATLLALGLPFLLVPVIKLTTGRPRPIDLYTGADAYSFPSNHAALSMVLFGITAILLARNLPGRWRFLVYIAAILMAALIGFSRVYLAVHWPSDVLAGLLFGFASVCLFAAFIKKKARIKVRSLPLLVMVAGTFLATYAVHMALNIHRIDDELYRFERPAMRAQEARILEKLWARDRPRRIELTGHAAEALFILETDLHALRAQLATKGWLTDGLAEARDYTFFLPSSIPLRNRPPLPLLHNGRAPLFTAVESQGENARRILRLWPTYDPALARGPLVGSLLTERLEPLAFGWSLLTTEEEFSAVGTRLFFADLSASVSFSLPFKEKAPASDH